MKETVEELYKILKIDRNKSPWMKKVTLLDWMNHLQSEIEEVKEALEKNDLKNLHEELGDIFHVAMGSLVIAEDAHQADAKNIISDSVEKLKRRKPWIFTNEELTMEEEEQRWNEVKEEEKNERNRS